MNNRENKWKTNKTMVYLNINTQIVTLNINSLNIPIKKGEIDKISLKKRSKHMLFARTLI